MKVSGILFLISIFQVNQIVSLKYAEERQRDLLDKINQTIQITRLPVSEFLCDNKSNQTETPENYIKSLKNSYNHILLGVSIENYSQYKLKFLSHDTSMYESCLYRIEPVWSKFTSIYLFFIGGRTREIEPVTDVLPYSQRLFIQDNAEYWSKFVYGSMSWQIIMDSNENKEKGTRLIVTYKLPYQ